MIEFGVGRGGGLVALEDYASEYGRSAGIEVEVYGFDLRSGLPTPEDYRDLSYVWRRGGFTMDVDATQRRLKSAKLILGDVRHTVPEFLRQCPAPAGFISFDLDYYSSTLPAFEIFKASDAQILPRVCCYFDDIVTDGHMFHCDSVGELLAIREFNETSGADQKLCPAHMINPPFVSAAPWVNQFWIYHRFTHSGYNTYIGI